MLNPEFKIFTGPMFGGKTTRLLADLERYKYQNKKIKLFKPRMEKRYSSNMVATHGGKFKNCTLVDSGQEILRKSGDAKVIAVDEVFMIDGAAHALLDLFSRNRTILVSSLQLSSEPKPLPEIKDLLPYATKIEVCPAVCVVCGKDAFYTKRKIDSFNQIEVGGKESYEPLCYEHYNEAVGIWRNR